MLVNIPAPWSIWVLYPSLSHCWLHWLWSLRANPLTCILQSCFARTHVTQAHKARCLQLTLHCHKCHRYDNMYVYYCILYTDMYHHLFQWSAFGKGAGRLRTTLPLRNHGRFRRFPFRIPTWRRPLAAAQPLLCGESRRVISGVVKRSHPFCRCTAGWL
jgi:hypothetical protein